jgi:hypothetical protein
MLVILLIVLTLVLEKISVPLTSTAKSEGPFGKDIITPVSTANLKQLNGQDPDKALENDEMLKRLAGRERPLLDRADEQRYH